jgi:hypothetical protein
VIGGYGANETVHLISEEGDEEIPDLHSPNNPYTRTRAININKSTLRGSKDTSEEPISYIQNEICSQNGQSLVGL